MKIKKNWKWILIFSIILGAILLLGTTKVNAVECSDVDKKVIINLDNLGIEGGKPELDFFGMMKEMMLVIYIVQYL